MAKTKSTKRALLMSVLSLMLCISMLIGTTYAWFTDSVTSAGNKIQSGTLKLDLELLDKDTKEWNSIKEDKTALFDYDLWEPGYTEVKVLKVENEGSLALKWIAKFVSDNDLGILADVIDVYVCPSTSELTYPADRDLTGYTHVGTVRDFVNTIEETTYGSLKAGESAYLGIALKMQESAGNEYQNETLGAFDIKILATQLAYESDSFDDQYDANAILADHYATNGSELSDAMEAGGYVLLMKLVETSDTEDFSSYTSTYFATYANVTRDTTLNLNGQSVVVGLSETLYASNVIYVKSATLDIVGDGSLSAEGTINNAVYVDSGVLNVYGGDIVGMVTAGTGAVVNIYGGSLSSISTYKTGTVNIYGGSFGFDPTNYLAEGYQTYQYNGVYYVVSEDVPVVDSADKLVSALIDGGDAIMTANVTIGSTVALDGGVLDGLGNEIIKEAADKTAIIDATSGTVKNVYVTGVEVTKTVGRKEFVYVPGIAITSTDGLTENLIIKNVVTAGTSYAIGLNAGGNAVYATDSTFTNNVNIWNQSEAVFEDCTFTVDEQANADGFAWIGLGGNMTFTNCHFDECIDFYANISGCSGTLTFTNCTFGDSMLPVGSTVDFFLNNFEYSVDLYGGAFGETDPGRTNFTCIVDGTTVWEATN